VSLGGAWKQRTLAAGVLIAGGALPALVLSGLVLAPRVSQAEAQPSPASALLLTPDPTVVQIRFPSDEGTGHIIVSDLPPELKAVTLRAQPLNSGTNVAFVQFPANADKDFISLNAPDLHCEVNQPCDVRFKVVGVRAEGSYQGAIDAYASSRKLASANLSAVRPDTLFQPTVSGDLVKNGQIEFDATSATSFVVTVQNPSGSPWRKFVLRDCSEERVPACAAPDSALAQVTTQGKQALPELVYSPNTFLLGPGKSQTVLARAIALDDQPHPRFLQVVDADVPALESTTLVVIKRLTSTTHRAWMLLLAVLGGAGVSVILNNVFPTSRARTDVEASLRRLQDVLEGCPFISPALRDAVSAEISRNRLIVRGIRFYHFAKESALLDVQQATTTLLAVAGCAKNVSALRSQLDSAGLPARTKLAVEHTLNEAEQALVGLDYASATTKIADAARIATTGSQPGTLAADLAKDIKKLLQERGNSAAGESPAVLGDQPRTPEAIAQSKQAAIDSERRVQYIADRLEQLELDLESVAAMPFAELLEVERDFYVADAWTELVEPALREDKQRFKAMTDELLLCLQRNPVSDHVQLALSMIQSSLTPADLNVALEKANGYIDCNDFPRYLDAIDCRFVFSDPCIQSVPAARRIVMYKWEFDDASEPPENFERCRHYFAPPSFYWLRAALGQSVRGWELARRRIIKLHVSMPGSPTRGTTFEHKVVLRDQYKGASELGMLQFMNFCLSTSIAVLAAFAAQYGSALPETLTWQAAVAAFMFGFGIDQIRDKATTTGPSAHSASPTAAAALQSPTPAAVVAQSAAAAARTP